MLDVLNEEYIIAALEQYYFDENDAYMVVGCLRKLLDKWVSEIDVAVIRDSIKLTMRSIVNIGIGRGIFGDDDPIEVIALRAYTNFAARVALHGDAVVQYLCNRDARFKLFSEPAYPFFRWDNKKKAQRIAKKMIRKIAWCVNNPDKCCREVNCGRKKAS